VETFVKWKIITLKKMESFISLKNIQYIDTSEGFIKIDQAGTEWKLVNRTWHPLFQEEKANSLDPSQTTSKTDQ
jgi:hypothetical protein